MLRVVAVLALAMAQSAPAHADEFEAYREERVLTCIEAAGRARDALRACIGAAADPCIDEEGGATMAYVLCFSYEADTWRELMDGATARLTAEQSYRDPHRLSAATKAWQTWMEAECDYWAWQEGGGSGEQVDRASCAMRITAERAISYIAATD